MKRMGRREGKTGFSLSVQTASSRQSLCWHDKRQEGGGRGQWEGQRAANMEPGVGLKLQLFPLLFVWFLFLATAHVNLRIQSITAMNDVAVSPYPHKHLFFRDFFF